MTIKTDCFATYDEIYGQALDPDVLQSAAARGRRLQARVLWRGLGVFTSALSRRLRHGGTPPA